ncbi:MAG: SusC/RagA family TonB-linked outer membrane protein [Bacteroidota bacterium]
MRILYTLLCMGLALGYAHAQSRISGTITDKSSGEPLPGVNIQWVGTTQGTSTDAQGNYVLEVDNPETAVLKFSFIGYTAQEIPLQGRTQLSLSMEEAILDYKNEVIVTALGLERYSRDLGYPIQQLKNEEISQVKAVNFLDNLSGKVAGVTINQGATGVGSTSRISIRGEASFTNNNPLFVVDGTPINNNTIVNFTNDAAAGFQEVDFGNGAMDVNPEDIESVSVLKGPGAAALYGTRASNGVVLITTKQGRKRQGIGISVNSTTFLDQAFQLPRFQNSYGQGNSGQFEFVDGLGGGTNDNITYSWGPAFADNLSIPQFDSPVTLPDGTTVRGGDVTVHGGEEITPTAFSAHPDNLKNFYRTGYTTINNVALDAGNQWGSYRLSVTDLRSESIIPGVNYDRQNVSARLNFQPVDRLSVNASVNYIRSGSDNRPSNGYGSENVNYSLVAWGPRSLNTSALQDYWQPGLENLQQYSFNYTFFDNPYFILLENRNAFGRDRLFGNINASYRITDFLKATVRTGTDYSNELRTFRRAYSTNRFRNGAYAEHTVQYRENNTDASLQYVQDFDGWYLDVYAGANRMDQRFSTQQTQAVALAQPGIFRLSNAAVPLEIFQLDARKRINSVYGIAKAGFRDFLFVEVTGRNDWSSALATPSSSENASFFYPSVSSAFIPSEVWQLGNAVDLWKVRASWSQVGNDTDPFQTAGVFQPQTPVNGAPTFSEQNSIANANLLPERTSAWEFGTELSLLNGRVNLDLTYYNAVTENQIISLPISITSGYNEQVVNGGQVRSQGWEALAQVDWFRSGAFRWNTGFNFSRNVTTVEELPLEEGRLTLAYSRVYDNVNQTVWYQVEEGGRIGDMYGTGYLRNENGDFVIDENGRYIVDNELQLLGNYTPDFILGVHNQFNYGNWGLNFLLDWRQGGILVSRTLALAGVGGQLEETEIRPTEGIIAEGVVNTGTAENPVWEPNTTAVTAEQYYRQFYDRNHEENNVYDASYLKLRELSLSYGFQLRGMEGQIALLGRNLFAISEIPHFDPEQTAVQQQRFLGGVEDMSYATTRSYGIQLNLSF